MTREERAVRAAASRELYNDDIEIAFYEDGELPEVSEADRDR